MEVKDEVNLVITNIGLAKIASSTLQSPLILDKFAIGDGGGDEVVLSPLSRGLVNEVYRDFINSKYSNNNNIVVECVLRANSQIGQSVTIREIGLFDEDGDLIAHGKIPNLYRPSNSYGQSISESIFNINLKIQNTDNIKISLQENAVVTVDMMKRIFESSIGIEKWFNTDNRYKDKNIIRIGIKTYALMDESNILSIADYPLLFKNTGAINRGDGTFAAPHFFDGTTRHLPMGSNRNLGSYEEDAFKIHNHNATTNLDVKLVGSGYITATQYNQSLNKFGGMIRFVGSPEGIISGRTLDKQVNSNSSMVYGSENFYNDAIFDFSKIKTDTSTATTSIADTGEEETRMKNTAGQWYILAKIDI